MLYISYTFLYFVMFLYYLLRRNIFHNRLLLLFSLFLSLFFFVFFSLFLFTSLCFFHKILEWGEKLSSTTLDRILISFVLSAKLLREYNPLGMLHCITWRTLWWAGLYPWLNPSLLSRQASKRIKLMFRFMSLILQVNLYNTLCAKLSQIFLAKFKKFETLKIQDNATLIFLTLLLHILRI